MEAQTLVFGKPLVSSEILGHFRHGVSRPCKVTAGYGILRCGFGNEKDRYLTCMICLHDRSCRRADLWHGVLKSMECKSSCPKREWYMVRHV